MLILILLILNAVLAQVLAVEAWMHARSGAYSWSWFALQVVGNELVFVSAITLMTMLHSVGIR